MVGGGVSTVINWRNGRYPNELDDGATFFVTVDG